MCVLMIYQGFVPEVHLYTHLECMGQYALARLAGSKNFTVSNEVTAEERNQFSKALAESKKYSEQNPRQLLQAKPSIKNTSKKHLIRQTRSNDRRRAHFHKQYQAAEDRLNHLHTARMLYITDKSKAMTEAAKKKVEQAEANAAKQVAELKQELSDERERRLRAEAMLFSRYRKKASQRFLKTLNAKMLRELNEEVVSKKLDMEQILIRAEYYMNRFPPLRTIIEQFINVEEGGLHDSPHGAKFFADLHKITSDVSPPDHLGSDSRVKVFREFKLRYAKITDAPNEPHDLDGEIQHLVEEVDSLNLHTYGEKRNEELGELGGFGQKF